MLGSDRLFLFQIEKEEEKQYRTFLAELYYLGFQEVEPQTSLMLRS